MSRKCQKIDVKQSTVSDITQGVWCKKQRTVEEIPSALPPCTFIYLDYKDKIKPNVPSRKLDELKKN